MNRSYVSAVLLAASLATTPVAAASFNEPSQVPGGHYVLDKNHSKILFSYDHFGFSTSYGLFSDFDSVVTFDPRDASNSTLSVSVNLNGINTQVPKLDEHLKSADFFNVAAYPQATFVSTKIEATGPTTGKIYGDLSLHGVTRRIALDATFVGGGVSPVTNATVLGVSAVAHIKRSTFGISTYVPNVGDDVTLTISAEYDRQQ